MINIDILNYWLTAAPESEHLEFKAATNQFDNTKLMRYCVALANEGGGHLVLGVSDKIPRQVVGTQAFNNLNEVKSKIHSILHIRVEISELMHSSGRVVIFDIPPRPLGHPLQYEGAYWMRTGSELVPMTPEQLRKIFNESPGSTFLEKIAANHLTADDVIQMLDTQAYFELLKLPYPSTREGVIARLLKEHIVNDNHGEYEITNLGALVLAKNLLSFDNLQRKVVRIIVYKGINKIETVRDHFETKGYAVGYKDTISYIHSQLPADEVIGQALRKEVSTYPEIAIRELVANALVHQDFEETGIMPIVEIYKDRIEITNPGKPLIPTERFIDEYKARNERLADIMRRMGICEERSSGIDKVVSSTERYQLPPPDFRVGSYNTTTILFAHREFSEMERADRVRACYLHCCLSYVSNIKMTNQSLRERFQLPETRAESVSRIIADTIEANLIKLDDPTSRSKRYAKYIPFWA